MCIRDSLKTFARFILWLGLYPFLLSLKVISIRVKRFIKRTFLEPGDFVLIFSIFVGLGYFFVGGDQFGFPKYHYPLFISLSILVGLTSVEVFKYITWKSPLWKDFVLFSLMGVIVFLLVLFSVGDLIYQFNFSLREAIVFNPSGVRNIFKDFLFKYLILIFLGMLIFFVIIFTKKERGSPIHRRFFALHITHLKAIN